MLNAERIRLRGRAGPASWFAAAAGMALLFAQHAGAQVVSPSVPADRAAPPAPTRVQPGPADVQDKRAPAPVPVDRAVPPSAERAAVPATTNRPASPPSNRVQTQADSVQYDRASGWATAQGHVVLRKGADELKADLVRYNAGTEEAQARGNVIFTRAGDVWRGQQASYNFKTRTFTTDDIRSEGGPYHWKARKSERTRDQQYLLYGADVSTCSNDFGRQHYHVTARRARVVPGKYLVLRGAVWRFGRVPVFYLPWWWSELSPDYGFRFRPGHDSRWGYYLLSSVWYRMTPVLKGETHVDYRSERGVGLGQDFSWYDRNDRWDGDLSMYYINDRQPVQPDESAATTNDASQRYRFRLRHNIRATDMDSVFLRANYLGDAGVLEDFFEDEFEQGSVPENYVVYSHRSNRYTANVLLQTRLNTFFDSVDRLPEFSLDVMRQQIGLSPFYYESRSSASFLQQQWADSDVVPEEEGYSIFRFDTAHMVYRPSKHFGFVNINPRAGIRETYFSKTLETVIEERTVMVTNTVVGGTNAVLTPQTMLTERSIESAAKMRSSFELGLEASYKAFATWGGNARPRRHIIQPYANWTMIPEPSVLPENLYQFDSVDELEETHEIQLGVRNKYQNKWDNEPHDLLDVDVYTVYHIHTEPDQDAITDFYLDADFEPVRPLKIQCDANYDVQNAGMRKFNTRLDYETDDLIKMMLEYRFLRDDSQLVSGEVTFFENRPWCLNVFSRYEIEGARLEEQGGYIQRNFDCLSVRTGYAVFPGYERADGTMRNDEWRIQVEFWLTAFPEVGIRNDPRDSSYYDE